MKNELRNQLADLLSADDPALRRRAAEDLAEVKGFTPIAALAAALRDENKGVRDSALRSLSRIGSENVARAAVEYIADENIVTRNLAAELLLKLREQSVGALLPYLFDVNQDVRKFAVDILGLIGNEKTVAHIIPLLDDPDENVVVSAAEALGNIRSPLAVLHLIRLFKLSDNAKAIVAEALGKIGDESGGDFLLKYFSAVIQNQEADPLVLYAVIDSIGFVGSEDALPVIRRSIFSVKGAIRHVLLHTMVRILERYKRPLKELEVFQTDFIEALRNDNDAIRLSAVKVLAGIEDSDVTAFMVKAVGMSEELDSVLMPILECRTDTFRELVRQAEAHEITPSKEIIVLFGRVSSSIDYHSLSKESLDQTLGLLQRAFKFVTGGWSEGSEDTRSAIIETMLRLDGDRAFEYLGKVADEPDPWLRIHVIELVAPLENGGIIEFLNRFLSDDDAMVREVAAATLESKGYNPRVELSGSTGNN
jgi:HEAT repeat protein